MSIVKSKLNPFIISVRKSLIEKNYYVALATALILPDICSKLEQPDAYTNKRYPEWFDNYVGKKYIAYIGPEKMKHVFLSGGDAYALRCSFVHQGEFDIT